MKAKLECTLGNYQCGGRCLPANLKCKALLKDTESFDSFYSVVQSAVANRLSDATVVAKGRVTKAYAKKWYAEMEGKQLLDILERHVSWWQNHTGQKGNEERFSQQDAKDFEKFRDDGIKLFKECNSDQRTLANVLRYKVSPSQLDDDELMFDVPPVQKELKAKIADRIAKANFGLKSQQKTAIADAWLTIGDPFFDNNELVELDRTDEPRSFAGYTKDAKRKVHLSDHAYEKTALHELGHILEDGTPSVQRAAQQLLASTRKSSRPEKLNKLLPGSSYKDEELAYQTTLDSQYASKIYAFGSTEITSIALQHFTDSYAMQELLDRDPDMYYFGLGVLAATNSVNFRSWRTNA